MARTLKKVISTTQPTRRYLVISYAKETDQVLFDPVPAVSDEAARERVLRMRGYYAQVLYCREIGQHHDMVGCLKLQTTAEMEASLKDLEAAHERNKIPATAFVGQRHSLSQLPSEDE